MISRYWTHHDVKTHRSKKRRKRGGLNEARRRRGDEQKATKKILISPPERARKVRYFVPQRPVDLADRKIPDGRGTTRRAKNRRRFSSFAGVPSDAIACLRTSVDPMENKKNEVRRCASRKSADDVTGACFGCLPCRRDVSLRTLHRVDRHQCGGQQVKLLRLNVWDIQAAIPHGQLDRFVRAVRRPNPLGLHANGPGSPRKDLGAVAAHGPGAVREDRCESRP
jgi:hypothetical protein